MPTRNRYPLPEGEGIQRKPLIFAESAYGTERLDDMEFADRQWDASYVPGYSELRIENERAVREGRKPVPMPRLQWVRVKKTDGVSTVGTTDEGMLEWIRLGYRACGVDDLREHGFGWPPAAGAGPSPDGLIRRGGDLALFIVDDKIAERNRKARHSELQEEADYVPDSKTGEVYPVNEERKDYRGSDIKRAMDFDLPNLP